MSQSTQATCSPVDALKLCLENFLFNSPSLPENERFMDPLENKSFAAHQVDDGFGHTTIHLMGQFGEAPLFSLHTYGFSTCLVTKDCPAPVSRYFVDHSISMNVHEITEHNIESLKKQIQKIKALMNRPSQSHYHKYLPKYRWAAVWDGSQASSPLSRIDFLSPDNSTDVANDLLKVSGYLFIAMDPLPTRLQDISKCQNPQIIHKLDPLPTRLQDISKCQNPQIIHKIALDLVMGVQYLHQNGFTLVDGDITLVDGDITLDDGDITLDDGDITLVNGDITLDDLYIPYNIDDPLGDNTLIINLDKLRASSTPSQKKDFTQLAKLLNNLKESFPGCDDTKWPDGKLFNKLLTRLTENNFVDLCISGQFGPNFIPAAYNTTSTKSDHIATPKQDLATAFQIMSSASSCVELLGHSESKICSECTQPTNTTAQDNKTKTNGAFWTGGRIVCNVCNSTTWIKYTTKHESYREFHGFKKLKKKSSQDQVSDISGPTIHHVLYYSVFHDMLIATMDYVEGEDINQEIREIRKTSTLVNLKHITTVGEVINVVKALANAIATLHIEYEFAHNDIKWDNVRIYNKDGEYIAKLLDLGGVVPIEPFTDLLQYDNVPVLHTPLYAAPESGVNQHATFAVDLFSLGMCALELIIGTAGIINTIEQYNNIDVNPTSPHGPDIPNQIMRANLTFDHYHKKYEDRFNGVDEDFKQLLRGLLSINPRERVNAFNTFDEKFQFQLLSLGTPPIQNHFLPRITPKLNTGNEMYKAFSYDQKDMERKANSIHTIFTHAFRLHMNNDRLSDIFNSDSLAILQSAMKLFFPHYEFKGINIKYAYDNSTLQPTDDYDFFAVDKNKNNIKTPECYAALCVLLHNYIKTTNATALDVLLHNYIKTTNATATANILKSSINQSNNNNNNSPVSYFYKNQTAGKYSISARTDIVKDKNNVLSYRTDLSRIIAAMHSIPWEDNNKINNNQINDEQNTYIIARNIAALADIINITTNHLSEPLKHVGATVNDFKEFQDKFNQQYKIKDIQNDWSYLPCLNDAYWKRLTDRHMSQVMHERCITSTPVKEDEQTDVDSMKKQTQLLPLEFGQNYLQQHFGIESVILECEPSTSDYNNLGPVVWQPVKSQIEGFPSHVKIWCWNGISNTYVGYDSSHPGLCVLYCIAYVIYYYNLTNKDYSSAQQEPQAKERGIIEQILDDLLLKFNAQLFGYLRRITRRINALPTPFDYSQFIDNLFGMGFINTGREFQIMKFDPVDHANLTSYLKKNETSFKKDARDIFGSSSNAKITKWISKPVLVDDTVDGNTPVHDIIFTRLLTCMYHCQNQTPSNPILPAARVQLKHLLQWKFTTLKEVLKGNNFFHGRLSEQHSNTVFTHRILVGIKPQACNRAHIISLGESRDEFPNIWGNVVDKLNNENTSTHTPPNEERVVAAGCEEFSVHCKPEYRHTTGLIKTAITTLNGLWAPPATPAAPTKLGELPQIITLQQFTNNDNYMNECLDQIYKVSSCIPSSLLNVRYGDKHTNFNIGPYIDPYFCPITGDLLDLTIGKAQVSAAIDNGELFDDVTELTKPLSSPLSSPLKVKLINPYLLSTPNPPDNKIPIHVRNGKRLMFTSPSFSIQGYNQTYNSTSVKWVVSSDASPFYVFDQDDTKKINVTPYVDNNGKYKRCDGLVRFAIEYLNSSHYDMSVFQQRIHYNCKEAVIAIFPNPSSLDSNMVTNIATKFYNIAQNPQFTDFTNERAFLNHIENDPTYKDRFKSILKFVVYHDDDDKGSLRFFEDNTSIPDVIRRELNISDKFKINQVTLPKPPSFSLDVVPCLGFLATNLIFITINGQPQSLYQYYLDILMKELKDTIDDKKQAVDIQLSNTIPITFSDPQHVEYIQSLIDLDSLPKAKETERNVDKLGHYIMRMIQIPQQNNTIQSLYDYYLGIIMKKLKDTMNSKKKAVDTQLSNNIPITFSDPQHDAYIQSLINLDSLPNAQKTKSNVDKLGYSIMRMIKIRQQNNTIQTLYDYYLDILHNKLTKSFPRRDDLVNTYPIAGDKTTSVSHYEICTKLWPRRGNLTREPILISSNKNKAYLNSLAKLDLKWYLVAKHLVITK